MRTQEVKSGALVEEYVGEVVSNEEAAERAAAYEAEGEPHFCACLLRCVVFSLSQRS